MYIVFGSSELTFKVTFDCSEVLNLKQLHERVFVTKVDLVRVQNRPR